MTTGVLRAEVICTMRSSFVVGAPSPPTESTQIVLMSRTAGMEFCASRKPTGVLPVRRTKDAMLRALGGPWMITTSSSESRQVPFAPAVQRIANPGAKGTGWEAPPAVCDATARVDGAA